jgi:predicted metal-dependent hydrolase
VNGEQLCKRWLELRDACHALYKRRPRVSRDDFDEAYKIAWRAWRDYAHYQREHGLPVRLT